ncbi:hypothetical protein [Streptomyces sp. FXY-T5]|uniref:hypothetical protein n=1 Tax=Streptomyces sp. FXY-T5 TaxID=3064901 RepID=UPI0027D2A47E|nr:hypothetical protein [Streptomyces sp. FXY-T5]WMD04631.1 hypothetical protein Q7C01_09605 [Streptomyces sp. FXY-T5]
MRVAVITPSEKAKARISASMPPDCSSRSVATAVRRHPVSPPTPGEDQLLGEFVGGLCVQVGELVATLLSEHVLGAVEPVCGPDGKVLVDERARAAVLTGEGVLQVPEEHERRLGDVHKGVAEDAERFTEAVDAVVRVAGGGR